MPQKSEAILQTPEAVRQTLGIVVVHKPEVVLQTPHTEESPESALVLFYLS